MMSKTALPVIITLLALESPAAKPGALVSGHVRVQPDGLVLFKGRALERVPLPPGPHRLKVKQSTVQARKLLSVEILGAASRSATLVATTSPETRVIFSGPTGLQGVDGEWSRHLQISARGVLLYQRRGDVQRCDSAPYFLFPRLFDFSRMAFRPVASISGSGAIRKTLRATRRPAEAPRDEPAGTFRLTFASTQRGDGAQAGQLGAPLAAQDHRPDTAWFEGLGGDGRGEFLIARSLDTVYPLRALRIIPGHAATRQTFQAANRIKSATLILSRNTRYQIFFPRDPLGDAGGFQDPYWVFLPEPVAANCATLIINEVYPGTGARASGGGQTAISELRFLTSLDFKGGLDRAVHDLRRSDPKHSGAAEAVLMRTKNDVIKLLAARIREADPGELRRIIRILARRGTPAAAKQLVRTLPLARGPLRELVITGLTSIGPAAVPLLSPGLEEQDVAMVDAAARVLGGIGGAEAQGALLAQVGRGNEARRAAVAAAIIRMGQSADLELFRGAAAASKEPHRLADLILILGTLGRRTPGPTCKLLERLARAVPTFEVRYRALQSMGRLDPGASQGYLLEAAQDPDPDLRAMALAQLALIHGDDHAREALVTSLADPQPQVRAVAARAMIRFPRDGAVGDALSTRLRQEKWGRPARALAEALGHHCGAAGIAELRKRALLPGAGVDLLALKSLTRCAPPDLGRFLVQIGGNGSARVAIRSRALTLLTPAAARGQAEQLFNLFSSLRTVAARDDDAERVAVALIRPLTLIGGPRAANELTEVLALDPHPSLRTSAAMALGRLCPPGGIEILQRSLGDVSEAVQRAARDGIARCKKGGR